MKVLDHGYIKLIEAWGSDERIIEAARMSTDKGFRGWGGVCPECHGSKVSMDNVGEINCPKCKGTGECPPGDEKLLAYLYNNRHSTPFEMAGLIVEVKAPIMVFREWHRHRTQSYNEMSARYIPLPDENYMPDRDRIISGAVMSGNKQANGTTPLNEGMIDQWLVDLDRAYSKAQEVYNKGLAYGIPKELARLPVPVARYSKMRASANLRNWLAFMTLRQDIKAQWEIRQFANALGIIVKTKFPRTWRLYLEKDCPNPDMVKLITGE